MARWDRMTAGERSRYVTRRVADTRAAQGLPPKVEDPVTLARLADFVASRTQRKAGAA